MNCDLRIACYLWLTAYCLLFFPSPQPLFRWTTDNERLKTED
jgi:hypothetical protein